MIPAAVGCLAFASLGYELLITRFFSITHWSHLSFLAVGLAMFGYAVGGTLHTILGDRLSRWISANPLGPFAALSCVASVAIPGSYCAVKALPLDYLRFPLEPFQGLYLLLTWILLSLPFLAAGLATSAAYADCPDRSGTIAGASFLGSALGALAPSLLLPVLGEGGSITALALVPLFLLFAPVFDRRARRSALGLCACILALLLWGPGFLSVRPSPYKTLPLLLQAPGSVVSDRQSGLRGLLEEVESPALRFAPGLSLAYGGDLPRQVGLVVDGDSLTVLYELSGPAASGFARWTHSFAPFLLAAQVHEPLGPRLTGEKPIDCLVLQQDGGLAALCALEISARSITLVSEDPRIALREARWYHDSTISLVADNPRAFLTRASPRYSVVVIEDWGPSIPGLASLQVDALLTVDSFRACWHRLTPRGVLAVSRRLVLPPSDSLRIFSEMLLALREERVEEPQDHLAVVRSWDSCTIIASRAVLDEGARAGLKAFAERRSFDLDYLPGQQVAEANRFSLYGRPLFAEAYAEIVLHGRGADGGVLDIAPQGDDRPFPSHIVRWTHVREFFRATGGRLHTLLLTGEIVAGIAFLQALFLSIGVLTLTFLSWRAPSRGASRGSRLLFLIVGLTGVGFMGTEMSAINALTVLFTSPTVALAIALGGLLSFSALGGLFSERVSRRALGPWILLAAVGLGALGFLLPRFVAILLTLSFPARAAAAIVLYGLPGFLIGIPFPSAMRILPGSSPDRARAWAVNGCASVMASIGSALLAPALGISCLLLMSAGAYTVAGLVCLKPLEKAAST